MKIEFFHLDTGLNVDCIEYRFFVGDSHKVYELYESHPDPFCDAEQNTCNKIHRWLQERPDIGWRVVED